eukprot:NODE_1410_length_1745_cov_99.336005_g1340_i0.p1 GENE.NODE_1410_length_1745_cov_99.336005_g1340_i0~~NODE_1410_length_1745_cov_99.336005_g1340_i0.p1  ORF type:complete len:255 (+),score=45.05 NODE_1410_length_1745_cov_99.336005_g1340_i0:69-767(+)
MIALSERLGGSDDLTAALNALTVTESSCNSGQMTEWACQAVAPVKLQVLNEDNLASWNRTNSSGSLSSEACSSSDPTAVVGPQQPRESRDDRNWRLWHQANEVRCRIQKESLLTEVERQSYAEQLRRRCEAIVDPSKTMFHGSTKRNGLNNKIDFAKQTLSSMQTPEEHSSGQLVFREMILNLKRRSAEDARLSKEMEKRRTKPSRLCCFQDPDEGDLTLSVAPSSKPAWSS